MDLYQLKAFFIFGKVKNFTRTAEIMNLTQSAVSHSLRKLENSAGTSLIKRKGRGMELSPAGKKLYSSCEVIFYEMQKVIEELATYQDFSNYELKLGAPVEFGTTILLKYIREFLDLNPEIKIDFHFSPSLYEPFVEDKVDIIIDCVEHDFDNCRKIRLIDEQYVVIASRNYVECTGLAFLEDLVNAKMLSIDKEGHWWKNFYESAFEGVKPDWDFIRINHVRGIINGAIHGIGVGFVPLYTVVNELKNGILINPFPHIRARSDVFSVYVKKEKLRMEKIIKLVDFLKAIKPVEFEVPDT